MSEVIEMYMSCYPDDYLVLINDFFRGMRWICRTSLKAEADERYAQSMSKLGTTFVDLVMVHQGNIVRHSF